MVLGSPTNLWAMFYCLHTVSADSSTGDIAFNLWLDLKLLEFTCFGQFSLVQRERELSADQSLLITQTRRYPNTDTLYRPAEKRDIRYLKRI
jgi:hypothetical protein